MNLASIRILTDDVPRLVRFYETLLGAPARWVTSAFAAVPAGQTEVAFAAPESLTLSETPGAAEPRANRSVYIEFLVDDVDAEYERLRDDLVTEFVLEPTTMPWGNRSVLFRDPDGNLINLFRRPSS
ncbi:MAG TPA: VOC family protein [Pseudolysinimonas sp.]|jgi:catechol 2,3-dioxygenase-like lactoylglutathione lyase family enzyme|nr:VOC family protein [Pseudolysinimonas sp.]